MEPWIIRADDRPFFGTVFAAHPLPNGTQVLVPHRVRPRSCVRLDGFEKVCYDNRREARRGCRKQETTYRCAHCGTWHRATKRRGAQRTEQPAAWVRRAA